MKNPLLAFFLAFLPGMGHLYLNRKIRGSLYSLAFFGSLFLAFAILVITHGRDDQLAFLLLFFAAVAWFINMADMLIMLLSGKANFLSNPLTNVSEAASPANLIHAQNERFQTMLLSFIPGLGHFQLSLINRGLTFMISFFGLIIMIFFVAVISHQEGFLLFLGIVPVIWIYSFFDVVQQLNKKEKGEVLIDRTILEDFEEKREQGKKSKTVATLLSIFPGAGHLYLGLQKRGIQLMAAFLFSIYILDILRLSMFLFLIPLIWFFSFFDALQKASRQGKEELEDTPIITYFVNHQKWLGIILLALGCYYLMDNVLIPAIGPKLSELLQFDLQYWYYHFFQNTLVCILLIGGGIKLLIGSKGKKEVSKE